MFVLVRTFFIFVLTLLSLTFATAAPPTNFSQAKAYAKQHVYYDQGVSGALGTTYCGCDWRWVGRSGGRTDLDSCEYVIRSPQSKHMVSRAERTEWEHIVSAYSFGNQRQCWQQGGRKNCNATDPVFNEMEADMHNLTPVIGEVNADRSNYRMGMVSGNDGMYGKCTSKTDFKQRIFEPRNKAKGLVARIHFYMHDRYALSMSKQQQRLFMAWDKQHPASQWELERDRRIAQVVGHSNEFVTGEHSWSLGYKTRGDGVVKTERVASSVRASNDAAIIHGNRNSKIYHLSECPSYNAMKASNIVKFNTEKEAQEQGFRKAKNCP